MAISFSRPDPSSPAAVADANFPTTRRGFDQQEVREFLRMVASELARMQERERYLEHELRRLRQQQNLAPTNLDDEALARLVGDETTRVIQAARESATATRERAEEVAERMIREARDEAQQLRADAEAEAMRRRQDAEADAEAELEMAKQQGREMVEEARAYRERALAELARRRDLARQQIDQLVHGRDRLVQAFERARLVAADVVAELAPLGELDEYVNLNPTTGPVPMMVPAERLGEGGFSSISDDALRLKASADPEDPPLDPRGNADVTNPMDRPVEPDASADAADTETTAEVSDEVAPPESAPETGETAEAGEDVDSGEAAEAPDADNPVLSGATVLRFPGGGAADADEQTDDTDDSEPAPSDEVGEADVVGDVDEVDDEDITANDVDNLFARLRAQREGMITSTSTSAADAAEASGEEVSPFERREEALIPLIVASARKLKRVLADEQNNALDRLRRKEPVTAIDDLVPDAQAHAARYFDAIAADLHAAAESGAQSLAPIEEQPAGVDVDGSGVLAAVRESVADGLVGPLRDRLEGHLSEGSGDNEEIAKSVRAVYREWKTRHIDDHLDDLLRLAYGRGAFAALEEGEPCRWIVDPAVGPCSDCEDNSLQGDVPAGTEFPTGHLAAPAHAGCRCLLAPSGR